MAFKNLLKPNFASGGDFYNSTSGIGGGYGAAGAVTVRDVTEFLEGYGSIKQTNTVSGYGGRISCSDLFPVQAGLPYSVSYHSKDNKIEGLSRSAVIYWYDSGGATLGSVSASIPVGHHPDWIQVKVENKIAPPNAATGRLYATTGLLSLGDAWWLDKAQVEQNDYCTEYEFPGVDMTSQTIESQDHVEPLRLNNILAPENILGGGAFGFLKIQSELQFDKIESDIGVSDLLLQSILELQSASSEEEINNLHIYYKRLIAEMSMKHPTTTFKIKSPTTILKIE